MATLKELQDNRATLAKNIKDLAGEIGENWTAENQQKWDAVNATYDTNLADLNAAVEKAKEDSAKLEVIQNRLASLDEYKDFEQPRNKRIGRDGASLNGGSRKIDESDLEGGPEYRNDDLTTALQGWLMNGSAKAADVTDRHQAAARSVHNSLTSPQFAINLSSDVHAAHRSARVFRNALSGEDGSSGGYTKDQTLMNSLELAMLAYGGVMNVADIIRTTSGETLRWPTADDTANTGAQVGENGSHDNGSDPSFGSVVWNAYTFSSKVVKVPNELLTDSVVNLASELGRMLGERLGRIQNSKYTTGTGAGTAKGITLCASAGVTTASSTAIAFDELIDLEHSLDPSRRMMPGVGYMFNDAILKALRKLKDGEGRYLWQSGTNTGAPDTLNTYPYQINQDMASSIATTAITVLFGDLKSYKIRQVGQIVLKRLDERYADTNQTGFLAIMRGDGNLLNAGDNPVKKLTQV